MIENNTPVVYPLEQVLAVKVRRLEIAEREMNEKKKILEEEQEKLLQTEQQRDEVKQHHIEKLMQFREILDHETRTNEVQQARNYIDLVADKLRTAEERVQKQKQQCDAAQLAFDEARKNWKQRRKEVEKIESQRESWLREAIKEYRKEEAKELEEVGTLMYLSNRLKNNHDNISLF
ncbi:type III secretion T3S chaperone [Candidatus Similichlamydia epinepheli]|uniref:type III secretion T3S chaperone n=1 Tax=Candidatus Similichlamydia epinepheli TaxID=1903953 RepID=UPI000D380DB1|nr:type III secretion T3S chaperone [Candidatus Similichlamydia epinepheli]